jgi:hypothetical protein
VLNLFHEDHEEDGEQGIDAVHLLGVGNHVPEEAQIHHAGLNIPKAEHGKVQSPKDG